MKRRLTKFFPLFGWVFYKAVQALPGTPAVGDVFKSNMKYMKTPIIAFAALLFTISISAQQQPVKTANVPQTVANDYFELVQASSNTAAGLVTDVILNNPNRPVAPSIIVTITRISD